MSDYFSDRENGPRARTEQVITPTVWAATLDGNDANLQERLEQQFAVAVTLGVRNDGTSALACGAGSRRSWR